MPHHLRILLAVATTLIGAVPAFAYGSAASHSSSSTVSRAGTAARSVGRSTSTRMSPVTRFQSHVALTRFSSAAAARMLVLTALGVLTKTRTTSMAAADPPAADPPASSAAAAATSPGTLGVGGLGSSVNLSQFNTGALDVATPAVSPPLTTDITSVALPSLGANLESAIPAVSALVTTASAPVTTVGTSIISVENLLLLNTATSGAVAQAPTIAAISSVAIIGSRGEVIATSGGSSLIGSGAAGRTLPECIAAWDKPTHMTKTLWREVCARTLKEEYLAP
jgi:hypothetical protein